MKISQLIVGLALAVLASTSFAGSAHIPSVHVASDGADHVGTNRQASDGADHVGANRTS
ncbi:MAG: hypothetical protein JWP80_456 [Pseudomonas sp.]|nr:hypothetical protein [Pseudomonas sp.]